MSDPMSPGGRADDVHALAAAYALDAVDPDERAQFEAHLATCEDCRREVAEFSEASVLLTDDLKVAPPVALREQLLAQIAVTPQDAAGTHDSAPEQGDELAARRVRQGGHRVPHERNHRQWWIAGAAAAAIGLGAIAVNQWMPQDSDPAILAVQEVIDAPDAVRTTESVDGATVTVVTAYSLDRAVLLTDNMDAAPQGQDYQLWFVHEDGTAVSAGLMPREGDEILLEGDPTGAVAVGITVEPAGGSDQPTSDPLVAVPIKG